LFGWLELRAGKYHEWKKRYGKVNEHNGLVPRDHWLEAHEQQAILDFERQYPLEGYRRLTFMMLDADIVAVSPTSDRNELIQYPLDKGIRTRHTTYSVATLHNHYI